MAEGTSLSLELHAQPFVESIDKSAAKIEEFAKRGEKAMSELGKSADSMSTTQKRAYDVLNSTMTRHQKEIAKISKEYEILREKQKNGTLNKDEAARLKSLTKEYKSHAGAVATTAKELENLARRFKSVKSAENQVKSVTPQVTHTFTNLALAIQGCKIAFDAAIEAIKSFGLAQEQQIAQLAAMRGGVGDATEAFRLLNDSYRNTNWSTATVAGMTKSFIALGYSAKDAAGMIGTIGDAAAGLGLGEGGGQAIADMLKDLKATGELEGRDIKKWQQIGVDLGKIFGEALGKSSEEAMKAIKDGQVSGDDAFKTIVNYLDKEYKGAMADAKDNTIDAIGDITGNVETAAGEIGAALIRALGFGDLAKDAVEATEQLVQVSRGINDTGDVWQSLQNTLGKNTASGIEDTFKTLLGALSGGALAVGAAKMAVIAKDFDAMSKVPELLAFEKFVNDIDRFNKEYADFSKSMGVYEAWERERQLVTKFGDDLPNPDMPYKFENKEIEKSIKLYKEKIEQAKTYQKIQDNAIRNIDLLNNYKGSDKNDRIAEQFDKKEYATRMMHQIDAQVIESAANVSRTMQNNMSSVFTAYKKAELAAQGVKVSTATMSAELVSQVGVWKIAEAATWGEVRALYAHNTAQLAAMGGGKGLIAVIRGIGVAMATSAKAFFLAIGTYLLTPVGMAITACAALGAAIGIAYSKWSQWKREKEAPIVNTKAVEGLSKLDFGEGAISKVASENTAKLEKMQEAVKGIVTEDSRLAIELKKLVEQAKEYEQQLAVGAIGQEEYARKMNAIYKSAENLKRELREIAGKNLSNLDLVKAAVDMQKTKVTVDNLADSLKKLGDLTHNNDFARTIEAQIKNGSEELEKLGKQIDEVKRKLSEGDPGKEDELIQKLSELQRKYGEVEKSVERYKQTNEAVKESVQSIAKEIELLTIQQEDLTKQFNDGVITEDEYKTQMEKLVKAAEGAKNGIAEVNLAVSAANVAMADGVLSAQEYAQAIAAVAAATAKIAAGQKGLANALENGGDTKYWESYLASAAAEVAYEREQIQKMRDHVSTYGADGRGTQKEKAGKKIELGPGKDGSKNKSGGGGGKGGESEAAKRFKADKQYADQMRQLERENQRYLADLEEKTKSARMKNSEELAQNLLNLYKMTGAKEAAHQQQRVIRNKQMYAELAKLNSQYAKQLFEAQQNLAQKQQDLLDAQKSKELGIITPDQYEKQKALLEKQIEMIDRSINDLLKAHKEDSITIQVKANLNQITDDLQHALDEAAKKREYENNGDGHISTADKIRMNADSQYEESAGKAMQAFNTQSQSLATSAANGDADGIANIGRLIGMSDDEIMAKGECISAMYQSVSDALVNATTQEVDGFARTRDSAMQHASALQSAQKAAKDYAISVGKNLGDAFSDWILGAKTAKQAMEDFAANLIKQAAQILAEWLGVYAILLLCGSNPHDASRGASKAVLGIDTKKDGGLIRGPGGPRSDSIPTMLSNGEYVINAAAVESIGKGNLDFMNRTGHMADGGMVGDPDNLISSGTVVMNISAMDALSFQDFLEFRGISGFKQAMRNESRRFATNTGTF